MPSKTYIHPNCRDARFPGILRASRELNVERTHLYRVLTGERPSARMMRRWKEWLSQNPELAAIQKQIF